MEKYSSVTCSRELLSVEEYKINSKKFSNKSFQKNVKLFLKRVMLKYLSSNLKNFLI